MPGLSRVLRALSCLLLLAGLGAVVSPASATSSLLCEGYTGCAKAGMGNAGYKAASGSMYWRMYAGHNCTNYVAYRLIRNGMGNDRPWSGGGNATYWGTSNADITDGTPAVGAVAWWAAGVRPAGSAGHVAYVEQVISPTEIVVSQDSWGGDFSWARITKAGGSWPSGFVHFQDLSLENAQPPAAVGTARVGQVLSASPGAWSPTDVSYSYQWRAGRKPIAGATGSTLTLGVAQKGRRISVRITANKMGYAPTSATSAKTPPVEPDTVLNATPPTIAGTPRVDEVLRTDAGTWETEPDSVTYQWNADGAPLAGQTGATLSTTPELIGRRLSVTATAHKAGYLDGTATSGDTTPVAPGTFRARGAATLSGTTRPGRTLRLTVPRVSPRTGVTTLQWLRNGDPIAGADGAAYRLTADDLGARLSARITVTRPGYTTLTLTTPHTAKVRARSRMQLHREPRGHRVRLTVIMSAGGDVPVTGTVRVVFRHETVAEMTVRRDGTAAATLRGLPQGRRTVKLRYSGSATVERLTTRRTVRVR